MSDHILMSSMSGIPESILSPAPVPVLFLAPAHLSLCPFTPISYSPIFPFSLFLDFKGGWERIVFFLGLVSFPEFIISRVFIKISVTWIPSVVRAENGSASLSSHSRAVSNLGSYNSLVIMSREPKLPGFGSLPATCEMCDHSLSFSFSLSLCPPVKWR